jgi:DNA (cytosine-5)-methyltransferase 1
VEDADGVTVGQGWRGRRATEAGQPRDVADGVRWNGRPRIFGPGGWSESEDCRAGLAQPWAVEPDVGRVAHGVPARVDRLRALGNALVPQIAEHIGRRIVSYEANASRRAA